ncbi:hypothetical protein ACJBU6_01385 [Exserohilum turcicum]
MPELGRQLRAHEAPFHLLSLARARSQPQHPTAAALAWPSFIRPCMGGAKAEGRGSSSLQPNQWRVLWRPLPSSSKKKDSALAPLATHYIRPAPPVYQYFHYPPPAHRAHGSAAQHTLPPASPASASASAPLRLEAAPALPHAAQPSTQHPAPTAPWTAIHRCDGLIQPSLFFAPSPFTTTPSGATASILVQTTKLAGLYLDRLSLIRPLLGTKAWVYGGHRKPP